MFDKSTTKLILKSFLLSVLVTTSFSGLGLNNSAFANDANMKSLFDQINTQRKGPFGLNVFQHQGRRQPIEVNGSIVPPTERVLFTSAYPNDLAKKLASEEGLFLGLKFTTAYVSAHKKFKISEGETADGFIFNLNAFMSSKEVYSYLKSLTGQMILEKFYIENNPSSKIAVGHQSRGVSDADNEKTYYGYLTNYLARNANFEKPEDYLSLFELQRRFFLSDQATAVSLPKIRADVAAIYDSISKSSAGQVASRDFLQLRNSIHNAMTPDIIGRLEKYTTTYKSIVSETHLTQITTLKSNISSYYKITPASLAKAASAFQSQLPNDFISFLNSLPEQNISLEKLEALGQKIVFVKDLFTSSARNPEMIHWIIKSQTFIQNNLTQSKMTSSNWKMHFKISLSSLYGSGLVSKNLLAQLNQFLNQELRLVSARDSELVQKNISLLASDANKITNLTFAETLKKWSVVYSKSDSIVDDTLRGSMMTNLNQIYEFASNQNPEANSSDVKILRGGEFFGRLVYVPADATQDQISRLNRRDIVIFAENPLYLGVVEATISEKLPLPGSHISIKSESRGTPGAFLANASKDQRLVPFLNKLVKMKFDSSSQTFSIRHASETEAQTAWQVRSQKPELKVVANLSERRVLSTRYLRTKDFLTVGAKTANYAEAAFVVPDVVLEGWGIPFVYYKEFMESNMYDSRHTLYQQAQKLLQDPRMLSDKNFQVDALNKLREKMVSAEMKVDSQLVKTLTDVINKTYPERSIRFRSSTNSEDLPNFSGAGLYDSFSYTPGKPKKTIEAALKGTWASVWNQRAFEEREEFGIKHLDVYMAILVSPGFKGELVNGVAITRNIRQDKVSGQAGIYINSQKDEEAITNPDPTKNLVSEELVVANNKFNYIQLSNINSDPSTGKPMPLMTDLEVAKLSHKLTLLHKHFKSVFDPLNKNPQFAIDVEFKIFTSPKEATRRGIFIKQARPYIGAKAE